MADTTDIAALSIKIESSDAKKATDNLDNVTESAEKAETATDSLTKEFDKLTATLRESITQLKEAASTKQQLKQETQGTEQAVKKEEEALAQLGAKASGAGISLKEVAEGNRELGASAKEAETFTSGLRTELVSLAAHTFGFLALVHEIGSSGEEFLKFSTAMADINTIMPNSDGLDRMTKDVKEMAAEFGKAPVDEARGLYQVISAGVTDATKQMDILRASNTLTIDGMTDQATAVDAVTTLWATYGKQVGSVQKLTDLMFTTVAAGKLRMGDLAGSIGMVASIASQAGVDLPSLLAAIDALTNSGVPARRAIQGVREALATIAKPSIEASRLAKQLGIDYSLTGLQAKGLSGFLKDLEEKTGGDQEKMAVLTGSVQAWAAVAPLAGTGAQNFADSLERLQHSTGEAQRALRIMQDSPEFKFNQFKTQIDLLKMDIGQGLVSAILPGMTALTQNFGTFTSVLKVAAEAMGVLIAMRSASWAADAAREMLVYAQSLGTAAGAADALDGAMAFVGGPVGLATAGIIAAAAALKYWADASDRALEAKVKWTETTADQISKEADLSADIYSQQRIIEDSTKSVEEHQSAQEQLKRDMDALIAIDPSFQQVFKNTKSGADQATAALQKLNDKYTEMKKKEDELRQERDKPQESSWQGFLTGLGAMGGGMSMGGMSNAGERADELHKEHLKESSQAAASALVQAEQNTKKAKDAIDKYQMALADADKGLNDFIGVLKKHNEETKTAASSVNVLTKEQQKQIDKFNEYLHNLQEQNAGLEGTWEDAQKASDAYSKLTAAQKAIIDPILDEIQARKELEKAREIELTSMDDAMRAFKNLDAVSKNTPWALDAAQNTKDLDSLEKRLKGNETMNKQMALTKQLYDQGRISQKTYYSQLIEYLDKTDERFKLVHEAGTAVASDLATGFLNMANGTKDAFKSMVTSILQDLERLAAQKTFEMLLGIGLNALAGAWGGGGAVIGGGGVPSDMGPAAYGTSFNSLAAPASVPSRLTGPSSKNLTIVVPTTVHASDDSGPSGQDQQDHAKQLSSVVQNVVKKALANEMRPGGLIYNANRGGR